ncbi:probable basic-leucine zipper transcription factor Q [Culex quinquefasciatus]|uniref:probable basic-leucine zipper transcription factor Q n=1 Tax=Culex quinquefasciatus TaxID=7176 RepID=UPI0018E301F0|nr:probable basic-leucine zipper transcription factor Q [Culex quinquefasciatus]
MTEEIQTQQSQQQQQQQQQQLQQQQQQSDSVQPQQQQQQKPRLGPNDYRNSEFVTKLMAANPPYMFSPAIGPHNFFFSEMLRSLVANKRNESLRSAEQLHHQQQQQREQQQREQAQAQTQSLPLHTRRPRKRSWSQHRLYPDSLKELKESEDKPAGTPEKPLELTNKLSAFTRNITSKYDTGDANDNFKPTQEAAKTPPEKSQLNNNLIPEPSTASMPPSDLILPPPPPVWYPPLYPPYGIDPLHFFIDLRVSGHIYDRKKDAATSDNSTVVKSEHSKLIGANDRQGSAFSVPKPRDLPNKPTNPAAAINLSSPPLPSGDEKPPKTHSPPALFLGDFAENKYDIIKNTNYVMQNLPRIYGEMNHATKADEDDRTNGNLSDDQQDCKSVGSNEEYGGGGGAGDEGKFHELDLNVISDEEESIAVDEN